MIDLSQFISHETMQDALLAIVAVLLKSAVKLLHKIHSIFLDIQSSSLTIASKTESVVDQNKHIILQNEEIVRKVTSIQEDYFLNRGIPPIKESKKTKKAYY